METQHETQNQCSCGKSADGDNRHSLCPDCWSERYFICENCSEEYLWDDARDGTNSDFYCSSCWQENYFDCSACSKTYSTEESFYSEADEADYCRDCYNDRFFVCEDCNRTLDNDEYGEDGHCSECCSNNDDDDVWGTDFKPRSRSCGDSCKRLPSARPFGIEIECSAVDYFDTDPWGHVHDGSLPSGGREFISPVLKGDDGLSAVSAFCKLLKDYRARANRDCGLHLHIEVKDHGWYDIHKLLLIYEKLEGYLFKTQPRSRQDNNYCKKLRSTPSFAAKSSLVKYIYGNKIVRNRAKYAGERYYWLNIKPWIDKRGTVEIRLHAGTISYEKISNWIKLHLALVEFVHKKPWCELRTLSPADILNGALEKYPSVALFYDERSKGFTQSQFIESEAV